MYRINLNNTPNQYASFNIGEDGYDIRLKTVKGMLYADLFLNGEEIVRSRRCINKMPLIYTKRLGNFYFLDTVGNEDPTYDKLNDRFLFIYDETYII